MSPTTEPTPTSTIGEPVDQDRRGSRAQYAYGPQGERVWKTASGTTTYFYWGIGEKVGGQWTKLYVSDPNGKLVEYSGGTTWFFATNHLGTIAARMNVSGTLMETYRYLPYGERDAGNQTPHQYTGKERDNESGLDYFGARYYASAHGRWMSVDPVLHTDNPQQLNRYQCVHNEPVNGFDPDGREEVNLPGGWRGACWKVRLPGPSEQVVWFCFGHYAGRSAYFLLRSRPGSSRALRGGKTVEFAREAILGGEIRCD